MMPTAQPLPVFSTPACSTGYVGAHRPAVPTAMTPRLRRPTAPWVHRGLAVGTLAAGLWLAGSLSQASTAEAAPSSAPQPRVAVSIDGVPPQVSAVRLHVTAAATSRSGRAPAAVLVFPNSYVRQAETRSTMRAATGVVAGLGALPPARSGAAAVPPTTGSGARRAASTVISATAGAARSVPAGPLPAVAVPGVPALAVPALPTLPALPVLVPVVHLPAVLLPAVLVPAVPALPVLPAGLTGRLPAGAAAQPPSRRIASPALTATQRDYNLPSKPASSSTPTTHPGRRPLSSTAGTARPQQPPQTPAGTSSGLDPAVGLGTGGNNPLDGGLVVAGLSCSAPEPAGDHRGRNDTPPRKRASAPSTSPD
jgi:hypothetical protein